MTRYLMFTVLISTGMFAADKPVKMADLPAAVQKTVEEQSKGAVIRGLSKEVENGKTYYEAELKVNGHNKDLLIDPSGTLVEVEDEVALDSVPPAAKAALLKHAGKGKVLSVESVTKDQTVVAYEAKIKTAGGKTTEFKVSPEGAPAKEQ
jgi:uncharacterized membrane protein YkoI